jgi:hypothetical protein
MRTVRVVVAALALLLCAPLLAADPPLTALTIEVTNLDGKPLDRMSVIVRFLNARALGKFAKKLPTSWETRTNLQGLVRIPRVPQGKVLVQAIAKGYQTFAQEYVVAEPEQKITVKLNPPQPQYSSH